MRNIDSFYAGLGEPVRSCLEALRIIILKHDPGIVEMIKYGMPFFCVHKKMLCYFWIDKKTALPYIGFREVKALAFPWLDAGDRSTITVMHIDPAADLPLGKIKQTLAAAIEMIETKTKKYVHTKAAKAVKVRATKTNTNPVTNTGKPQSAKAGKPQSTKTGKPQSAKAGKPQSTKTGKPQSAKAAIPKGIHMPKSRTKK